MRSSTARNLSRVTSPVSGSCDSVAIAAACTWSSISLPPKTPRPRKACATNQDIMQETSPHVESGTGAVLGHRTNRTARNHDFALGARATRLAHPSNGFEDSTSLRAFEPVASLCAQRLVDPFEFRVGFRATLVAVHMSPSRSPKEIRMAMTRSSPPLAVARTLYPDAPQHEAATKFLHTEEDQGRTRCTTRWRRPRPPA